MKRSGEKDPGLFAANPMLSGRLCLSSKAFKNTDAGGCQLNAR
jgi:hypothetical protein